MAFDSVAKGIYIKVCDKKSGIRIGKRTSDRQKHILNRGVLSINFKLCTLRNSVLWLYMKLSGGSPRMFYMK